MKYDLGFGNSVCVREAFLDTYHGDMIVFTRSGLEKFNYPAYGGDPELVEITRHVIKRQIDRTYKHVFMTNGATGGVVIALRAFKQRGYSICYTRKAPWYLRYPNMIKSSGLIHYDVTAGIDSSEGIVLMDIPSNPEGIVHPIEHIPTTKTILDGVYLNKVYGSGYYTPIPIHDVYVGSYSKLLGLNGLRVGWIATDDDFLAERIHNLIQGEYCGLSVASSEIIKNCLFDFNWEIFEKLAKANLDYNREEWSKLERFFDRQVRWEGMFYYGRTDEKVKELLQKTGIHYVKGSEVGTNDDWGRFNLGQDVDLTRKAVKAIIREDLRPKKK